MNGRGVLEGDVDWETTRLLTETVSATVVLWMQDCRLTSGMLSAVSPQQWNA